MIRKALHVIPSVGPRRGGPSVMLRQLAANLAARGVQVDVATTIRCRWSLPVPARSGGAEGPDTLRARLAITLARCCA